VPQCGFARFNATALRVPVFPLFSAQWPRTLISSYLQQLAASPHVSRSQLPHGCQICKVARVFFEQSAGVSFCVKARHVTTAVRFLISIKFSSCAHPPSASLLPQLIEKAEEFAAGAEGLRAPDDPQNKTKAYQ